MSDLTDMQLPPSVTDFLCDSVVRNAVNSLLEVAESVMPAPLESSEIANYYRARAAALAVKYDTIITLEALWTTLWGEMTANWRFNSADQESLDPETIWENRDFWLRHETANFVFWSAVSIEDPSHDGQVHVRLYCSLQRADDDVELLNELAGFTWTGSDHEWDDWMGMDSAAPVNGGGTLDLTMLRDAVGRVKQLMASKMI
jgi:hypothetical protein